MCFSWSILNTYTQDNDQYVCPYGHLVNCFGNVFVGLLFLFLHLLLSSFMIWWLTMLCLDSLSYVCISITDFWFAVTRKFLFLIKGYAAAKSLQSCLTLCNPIDGSPPGSPVPGILQTRTLEWVAISFSNVWKWKVKVKSLRHARLLATPRTAAYPAPLSIEFSRHEYWSGLTLPSPMKGYMYM